MPEDSHAVRCTRACGRNRCSTLRPDMGFLTSASRNSADERKFLRPLAATGRGCTRGDELIARNCHRVRTRTRGRCWRNVWSSPRRLPNRPRPCVNVPRTSGRPSHGSWWRHQPVISHDCIPSSDIRERRTGRRPVRRHAARTGRRGAARSQGEREDVGSSAVYLRRTDQSARTARISSPGGQATATVPTIGIRQSRPVREISDGHRRTGRRAGCTARDA